MPYSRHLAKLSVKDLGEQTIQIGVNYAEFKLPYSSSGDENPFDVKLKLRLPRRSAAQNCTLVLCADTMYLRFTYSLPELGPLVQVPKQA